jgi:type II restriction/modification system DNA methylase subunit YeeA
MFIASHQHMRTRLVECETISSLVQLEYSGFSGATVPICTFTLQKAHIVGQKTCYIRLSDFKGSDNQAPMTREAIINRDCGWFFEIAQDEFKKIPGTPIAYWISQNLRNSFELFEPLHQIATPRAGMITGDNSSFVRTWPEVSISLLGIGFSTRAEAKLSQARWFPYQKGGQFRKWSGNREHVVDWENDGQRLRTTKGPRGNIPAHAFNEAYIFKPNVNWSAVSSASFSARVAEGGSLFDAVGSAAFPGDANRALLIAGFLNSRVTHVALGAINPTLHFQAWNIGNLPLDASLMGSTTLLGILQQLRDAAEQDWNAYERSWDFQSLPLLTASTEPTPTLECRYNAWITQNRDTIAEMKRLEEENNRLFIDAYGLTEELTPDVPIEQITLTMNPAYRYSGEGSEKEKWDRFRSDSMAEFLSYATGCMMGRYSLDQPGLILADSRESQAAQLAAYEEKVGKPLGQVQFKPDADAIIPVLDGEWFEDDIVARTREFLEVTFPESTVSENLRFIEESLGKDIRKYFCTDFYKDHLQTYKKRPIYWMVQIPKKGFACLIYLHRYTKDTLNQVLNNYFRPYLQKLEARLAQLGLDQLNDSLPTRERTAARKEAEKITKVLKECEAWEQDALLPLAQQRIELDLDDGVKVNYLKLQDVLAPILGLAAKED